MGSALAAFECICLLPIATPRLSPQLLLLLLTRGRPILSASASAAVWIRLRFASFGTERENLINIYIVFSSVCVFDSLATQTAQHQTAQNQTETLPIGFDLFLLPKFFANAAAAAAAADVDGKSFSALVAAVAFRCVGSVHQQHQQQHHQQMEWKCRVFFEWKMRCA